MQRPKRLVVLFIWNIIGFLTAIGTLYSTFIAKSPMPEGLISGQVLSVISFIVALAYLVLSFQCLKGATKARKLLFQVLCFNIVFGILNLFTLNLEKFYNENADIQIIDMATYKLSAIGGAVFGIIMTVVLFYWALFSKKSNRFFNKEKIVEENLKTARNEETNEIS